MTNKERIQMTKLHELRAQLKQAEERIAELEERFTSESSCSICGRDVYLCDHIPDRVDQKALACAEHDMALMANQLHKAEEQNRELREALESIETTLDNPKAMLDSRLMALACARKALQNTAPVNIQEQEGGS